MTDKKRDYVRTKTLNKIKSKDKKNKFIIILFLLIIILIVSTLIIFNNNRTKKIKIGNNSSSQEIVDYILNISSYEAKVEVNIKTNKSNNKYILKQQYIEPDMMTQEVLEPSNISGVKIIRKGNELKLENTNLSLSSIYNNYEYISKNDLDLNCFIDNYKNNEKSEYIEKDNQIIMKTKIFNMEKLLYIDKDTVLPVKMEIKDDSKKNEIYILYNEVKINSLNKEDILAFERDKNIVLI